MKITALPLAALMLGIVLLGACKKNPEPSGPAYGKLQVSFSNEVDGQPVVIGPISYKNESGNDYSVDLLKYYVTNLSLVKADSSETKFKSYNLIDASDPTSQSFTLDSVMNGSYTAVRFYLGVDSSRNHTGAQDGALDPANGMIWSWNTGYIFFKHEGSYKDSTGAIKRLVFHYGTDRALVKVTVPISELKIAGDSRKLFLKFNLNKLYATPHAINFNYDNNHMSSSTDDVLWLYSMSGNFPDAFQYSKSE